MFESDHALPFSPCIECRDRFKCPIVATGARPHMRVPDTEKCPLKQLSVEGLTGIAIQIENSLGMIMLEESRLSDQLQMILECLKDKDRIVVPGRSLS